MNAHITDEELLDVMNGHAADHVASHLVQCDECWSKAQQLKDRLAGFASTMRVESARAEAATLRRPVRVRAVSPRLGWAIAAAAVLVLAATAMLSSLRPSGTSSAQRLSPSAVSQTETAQAQPVSATSAAAAEQEQSDAALLMEVQDDMDRELPEALQPVSLIVAERNQFAEELTKQPKGENE
jgi:ABC-type transport system involved in cytochrome bd biosynthesis fused ATPase/permease subunit